jgi:hypothetical protein
LPPFEPRGFRRTQFSRDGIHKLPCQVICHGRYLIGQFVQPSSPILSKE